MFVQPPWKVWLYTLILELRVKKGVRHVSSHDRVESGGLNPGDSPMKRTGVLVVFDKNPLRFPCIKIKFGRCGLNNTLTDIDVFQLDTLKGIA